MTLNRFVLTAALVALAFGASAASAQERDARKREAARTAQSGSGKGESAGKAEARRAAPERRSEPARRDEGANRPASSGRAEPRRDDPGVKPQYRGNEVVGRAVPRERDAASVRAEKFRDAERRDYRGYDRRWYYNRNRYVAPRVTYYRPYVFHPNLSIGFGIFSGYPVPYTYRYAAPIVVYGYRAPRGPVYVDPGLYGGVALEIGPYDADVFVDGSYAGHVEDFDGSRQPLTLVPGTHRIEVQAPGFVPLVFDVTVQPGQVIPYRGDLRPY
jgi:hypothetical protein